MMPRWWSCHDNTAIRIELKRMEPTEFTDLEKTRSLFVMSGERPG